LAPEDFGLFAIVMVLTSYAPLLIDFGLGDATTQRSKITRSQVSSLFWLSSGIGLAFAVVCTVGSAALSKLQSNPAALRQKYEAALSAVAFFVAHGGDPVGDGSRPDGHVVGRKVAAGRYTPEHYCLAQNPHLHFRCAVIHGEPSLATSNDATSRSCEVQPNQTSEAGASTGQLHIPVAFQ
jgi:hypothetical protein